MVTVLKFMLLNDNTMKVEFKNLLKSCIIGSPKSRDFVGSRSQGSLATKMTEEVESQKRLFEVI